MNHLDWSSVINGKTIKLQVHPARLLLYASRRLGARWNQDILRAWPLWCMHGADGWQSRQCLPGHGLPVRRYGDHDIEGLAEQELHPIQQAFIEEGDSNAATARLA